MSALRQAMRLIHQLFILLDKAVSTTIEVIALFESNAHSTLPTQHTHQEGISSREARSIPASVYPRFSQKRLMHRAATILTTISRAQTARASWTRGIASE